MALAPGQLVVCIKDFESEEEVQYYIRQYGLKFPRKGVVYTVRDVRDFHFDVEWLPGLRLVEIVNPPFREFRNGRRHTPVEPGFLIEYFRPVQPKALDVLRAHLVDQRVSA